MQDNLSEEQKRRQNRDLQKWMSRNALEPIKGMVMSGVINPDQALGMIADTTRNFRDDNHEPEFKKFAENSGRLFEKEQVFDASYESTPGGQYLYTAPSRNDAHFFYKLHQHLGGRKWKTPAGLEQSIRGLVKDKRVLEIGCGPGFLVDLLGKLGAKASGVEMRQDYAGRIPEIDIKYGDAQNLDRLFDEKDNFDIIYSNDVFATACVERPEARRIAGALAKKTKDGGLGIHIVTYEKMHPLLVQFYGWMNDVRAGRDPEHWQKWYDNLSDEEQENILWTNECSLDPQFLYRAGFDVKEYGLKNSDMVIIASKGSERGLSI